MRIGRELRRARRARGWEYGDVAARTHIKPEYLQALEEERWEDFPSPAHVRGFLRLYAEALGLDPAPLLALLGGANASAVSTWEEANERPSHPSPTHALAQERLQDLGRRLRERRERLGYSLEQVAETLHIAEKYLTALETGDLDAFPSTIQARGMLAAYAAHLQMDVDDVLLRFAEALQYRAERPARAVHGPQPWQRWMTLVGWLFYGLVALAFAVLLGWGGYLTWQTVARASTATPTLPPVNTREARPPSALTAQALATALAVGTQAAPTQQTTPGTPVAGSVTPTPAPEEAEPAPIFLVVEARQRTWVRVFADGQPVFQGRLAPGERKTFRAESFLELITGNAGALRVFYNERNLGLLGDMGQVVRLLFTPNDILTPTPRPSPTPTVTPTSAATATPTATPAVSPEPSPTP